MILESRLLNNSPHVMNFKCCVNGPYLQSFPLIILHFAMYLMKEVISACDDFFHVAECKSFFIQTNNL